MESTPNSASFPESDSGSEDNKDDKKKKSSKKLGSFAADLKTERKERAEAKPKEESLWPFGGQKSAEAGESKNNVEAKVPEASEVEAPLERLGEAEQQLAAREIASERQTEQGEESIDDSVAEQAAEAAVRSYHERIIEGQTAEQALESTLSELEVPPEAEPETEPFQQESVPRDIEELREEPVSINLHPEAQLHVEEPEGRAAAPPPPARSSRRRDTLAPNATEMWVPGSGMYSYRGFTDTRPPALGRYEYVPARDELLLKNLPGGIVGYLIGRRRGRIKAEKQAASVKKKLEKQVEGLRQDIVSKEQVIKKKVREQPPAKQEQIIAAVAVAAKTEKAYVPDSSKHELASNEAEAAVPERLGQLIVDADRRQKQAETAPRVPAEKPRQPEMPSTSLEKVETLSRAELLNLSDRIVVDGSTLRQIYETKLVGERGLRRLVQEHLRGGDVKKALRQEIVEREIDFERDPVMRDHAAVVSRVGEGESLQALLKQQAMATSDSQEEVAFYKARATFETGQKAQEQKRRQVIDAALVGSILILSLAIVALYLSRQ